PPDWANPEPAGRYNLVVVGAGTAGLISAAGAARLGAPGPLVERGVLGGGCLHLRFGPSEAPLPAAPAAAAVPGAPRYGRPGPGRRTGELPGGDGADATAAGGAQPERLGGALPRPRRGRLLRRGPFHRPGCGGSRRARAALPPGGDRHRRPRRPAGHPRPGRG